MTITSAQLSVTWSGNGLTQVFNYPFLIPSPGQCSLVYTDAEGNQTAVSAGNFSISGTGNAAGGTLAYPISGSPIAAGTSLTLTRVVPYQQAFHPPAQGPIYPPSLEGALDALAMQIMQAASFLGEFEINGKTVTSANFTGALTVSIVGGVASINVQTTPGPTGPQGIQGIQGATGATGATGARGSIWIDGSGAPGTIAGTIAGDQYLDTATGNVYQLGSGGAWTKTADIMGPQGPQGVQGNTGSGSSIIVASGGTALPNPVTEINITGAGATVTQSGSQVTINIPGASSGAVELVSVQNVSGATEVDFTGLVGGYDYFIIGNEVGSDGNSTFPRAKVGQGTPTVWDTNTSNYNTGGAAYEGPGWDSQPGWRLMGGSYVLANDGLKFELFGAVGDTSQHHYTSFYSRACSFGAGSYGFVTPEPMTGIALYMDSGTISGNFYLYRRSLTLP
jgi:hypothetical protein